MRHQIIFLGFTTANCYRTVLTDEGIVNYYSVSRKRENFNYADNEYVGLNFYYENKLISITRAINRDISFKRIPYKNTRYQEYSQRFCFFMIEVTTPWSSVDKISSVCQKDWNAIKTILNI